MEKASVSNLKNNLSAYLRKVRAGHPVVIYDREVPIARLERIESAGLGSDRLASLHAKGVTRLPLRHASAVAIVAELGNPLPHATRLLEAVQQDRSEDR
jgi:prevent-host-death family protein